MKRVSRGIFGKPHNRRVTTRFRFQSGTLGQAGIHIEPHSTEGHRLGYLEERLKGIASPRLMARKGVL